MEAVLIILCSIILMLIFNRTLNIQIRTLIGSILLFSMVIYLFFIEKEIYAVLILLVAIAGVGFNIHKMKKLKNE